MPKTPKSTKGQKIIVVEVYPEDLAGTLMPGDIEVLKEKYGDQPCSYEVHYPWKKNVHHTWFIEEVYEKYDKTHMIERQRSNIGTKNV
tara:strand:+ start:308 stop:571 length:264 start_codon:yes stop_codon:yes gene_type:complete